MNKIIFLIPLVCLLCSCFQGQPINYPFNDISSVLKQKFMEGDKSFQPVLPTLEEEPGYMYLYLTDNIDFFLVVNTEIKLKKQDEKTSQIMIRINEHNRQWNYSLRQEDMEKDFFKCLEERMQTGRWKRLPWEIKYKTKQKNEFKFQK